MSSTTSGKLSKRVSVKQAARTFTTPRPSTSVLVSSSADATAYVDEDHPTGPVVHAGSRVLLCGTFPPVRKSINFYYPNANNDMWKVLGEVFFGNVHHFYTTVEAPQPSRSRRATTTPARVRAARCLNEAAIRDFASTNPIGFFDVCARIRRHRGNSSDDNLEALKRTNVLDDVLAKAPSCEAIITTGTLALTMLIDALQAHGVFSSATGEPILAAAVTGRSGKVKYCLPHVGGKLLWTPRVGVPVSRALWIYRAPSTSRAFPIKVEEKISFYKAMFANHLNLKESKVQS